MEPFSHNLNQLMALHGVDDTSLAARIGAVAEQVRAWREGQATPDLPRLVALAGVLQTSLDRLVLVRKTPVTSPRDIRMLVLDVDGVLTDCGIYLTEKGDEIKKFNARDGRGILTAQKTGIEVAFLSGGSFPHAIAERAARVGVRQVYVGKAPKTEILSQWLKDRGLGFHQVAYIGDDANDLEAIRMCGLTACPADAAPRNREAVDIVLRLSGGQGCVREFIEDYLGVEVD